MVRGREGCAGGLRGRGKEVGGGLASWDVKGGVMGGRGFVEVKTRAWGCGGADGGVGWGCGWGWGGVCWGEVVGLGVCLFVEGTS